MAEKTKIPRLRFKGFTETWEQRKLGDITNSYSGGTPTVGNHLYYGGDIPFIRSAEINSESTELFLTKTGLKNSSAKMVKQGDILYALYGATSGEVGRSRINGAINQAILAIIPCKEYDAEYLAQWLRKSKSSIIETYLQGGQGNLSGAIVKDLEIGIPESAEQLKIGSILYRVDNLITLHQRKYDKFVAIKKALLEKMFPRAGKSVPEIRFKGFTETWEQRKFLDIAITRRGLTYSPDDIASEGVRVLRSSNISEDVFILSEDDVFVCKNAVNIEFVKNNDILITSANGSTRLVGKHTIIVGIEENAAVHGGFMLLATAKQPFFLNASMSSNWYAKFISLFVAGGNGAIGNLSKSDLDDQILYCPTELEQEKIGEFYKTIDNLITLHQRQLERLKNIKAALLEKMFV